MKFILDVIHVVYHKIPYTIGPYNHSGYFTMVHPTYRAPFSVSCNVSEQKVPALNIRSIFKTFARSDDSVPNRFHPCQTGS